MGETDSPTSLSPNSFPSGGNWGLVLMIRTILSKSLIPFSVDEWGCVPSLLFDRRPNYGGGNEDNGKLLQNVPCMDCCTQCPQPAADHCQPMAPLETRGHSQASLGQSLMGSLILSPKSCYTQGSVCALQEPVSPVLCKFCNQFPLVSEVKLPVGSQSLCQISRLGNLLWVLELS